MFIILLFQFGWTALMKESYYGHKEIAKYLIQAKASLDLKTQVYVVHQINKTPYKILQCFLFSKFRIELVLQI